jgi:hypothetical protein
MFYERGDTTQTTGRASVVRHGNTSYCYSFVIGGRFCARFGLYLNGWETDGKWE